MSESTLLDSMKSLVSEQNNTFQAHLAKVEELSKGFGEHKNLKDELTKLKTQLNSVEEMQGRQRSIGGNGAKGSFYGDGTRASMPGSPLSEKVRNHQEFKSMMERPDRRGMLNMVLPGSLFETKAILTSIPGSSITQVPGVVQQPVAMGLRGLIPVRQVSTGTVAFLQQAARTGAKAGVQPHEGDLKNEIALVVNLKTVPISTVAAWTKASKQILDDLEAFLAFLDNELTASVLEAETNLILNGDVTNPGAFDGLLKLAAAYTDAGAGAGNTSLDVLIRARTALAVKNVTPTGLILSPADAGLMAGLKTADGNYLGATTTPAFMGLTAVVTSVMPVGKFLLGDFRTGAEIEERESVSVQVSSEDGDNFKQNLITVLAEERVSLSVFKPWAFLQGSLTPVTLGTLEAETEQPAGNGKTTVTPTPTPKSGTKDRVLA